MCVCVCVCGGGGGGGMVCGEVSIPNNVLIFLKSRIKYVFYGISRITYFHTLSLKTIVRIT